MSDTDEAVGRVTKELDRQRSWAGMAWADAPRVSVPSDALRGVLSALANARQELRASLAALARVSEERDAAREVEQATLDQWNAMVRAIGAPTHGTAVAHAARIVSDLATLRERLAGVQEWCDECEGSGEVGAPGGPDDLYDVVSKPCTECDGKGYTVAVIRGER